MNSFVIITFLTSVVAINGGLYHGPSANILQEPSTRTTLVGPEGSVISAVAPGGQIIHEEHPGVVAHAAPVFAHSAYTIAHHAAPVAYAAHAAPSAIVAHSSAYGHGNTIVAGPSGTISTGQAHHATPAIAYAAPVIAHHSPVVAHAHGHEGQYAHDYSETLYDDGSYKPHFYH